MEPAPIQFLGIEDVLLIQHETIERDGGGRGVRNLGALGAAVMMSQPAFGGDHMREDRAAVAAAYLLHIVTTRAFADGNKRAGAMSALVFLDTNGVANLPNPKQLEQMTLSVAAGQVTKSDLTAWFRAALA